MWLSFFSTWIYWNFNGIPTPLFLCEPHRNKLGQKRLWRTSTCQWKSLWSRHAWDETLRHRVKYGLDHFLDHFLGHILDFFFLDHFRGGGMEHTIITEGGVGWSLSVLREGWEAECYYSGRGVRRTIITKGGVGGGCNGKHYWLMLTG